MAAVVILNIEPSPKMTANGIDAVVQAATAVMMPKAARAMMVIVVNCGLRCTQLLAGLGALWSWLEEIVWVMIVLVHFC